MKIFKDKYTHDTNKPQLIAYLKKYMHLTTIMNKLSGPEMRYFDLITLPRITSTEINRYFG